MRQYTFEPNKDFDKKLEASVLGALLSVPHSFSTVHGVLNEECFYCPDHAIVFRGIVNTFNRGLPVDLITVTRDLYDAGTMEIRHYNTGAFLAKLTLDIVHAHHLDSWCVLLRELQAKRELIKITCGGLNDDDVVTQAAGITERIRKVMEIRAGDDWQHIGQVGVKVAQHIDEATPGAMQGITTSFRRLNKLNGGFKAGMMVVLGARPGVGKSALMGRMAVAAAKAGAKVGVMSLEMEDKDLVQRMMSTESNVPFYNIDRNDLQDEQQRQLVVHSLNTLSELPIFFSDATQVNIHDIRAKAEKLKERKGLDILFIDYLQLVESTENKNRNREQEVAAISRGIKLLARSLKIPVVVLAQLNRQADNKPPELSHLRESGSIEQDADAVLFLHHGKNADTKEDETILYVRKWRNGAPAEVKLRFEGEVMGFEVV